MTTQPNSVSGNAATARELLDSLVLADTWNSRERR
jgi:hypothetical protein